MDHWRLRASLTFSTFIFPHLKSTHQNSRCSRFLNRMSGGKGKARVKVDNARYGGGASPVPASIPDDATGDNDMLRCLFDTQTRALSSVYADHQATQQHSAVHGKYVLNLHYHRKLRTAFITIYYYCLLYTSPSPRDS